MTNTQSWIEWLTINRYDGLPDNVYDNLNSAGNSELRIWSKPGRWVGQPKWSSAWSDILQIASQVLKETNE